MNEKPSPHRGSDFDDFLIEQGIFEEVMSSPKIKKAIRDLGDSIQAGEREAFAAGWNAFVAALKFFDQSQHRRYSDRIGAGLGKVLEKPERKIMPVEEPRRKRKRGIEEPDRYPEPKRETKPQIVPPGPPKPPKKAPPGTK